MHAAIVRTFGETPTFGEFEEPVAREGELPVKVAAAGLHPIVKALASGTHYGSTGELPFIPGVDGVGRLGDGSRVVFGSARSPFGTFAERAVAASWMCTPLPDGLDDVTAAGIANPAMSSWVGLMRGQFVAGESVLILGATGVSGQLAVQVARRRGARRVVGAGRNADALEKLTSLGADRAISLEQEPDAVVAALREEYAEKGVDVVLDYLWGQPAEWMLAAIAQKGLKKATPRVRYVQIGNSAGPTITLPAMTLRSSGLEMVGSGFGSASMEQILAAVAELFADAAKEPFVFEVKTAPLSEVEKVWGEKESGVRVVFRT